MYKHMTNMVINKLIMFKEVFNRYIQQKLPKNWRVLVQNLQTLTDVGW